MNALTTRFTARWKRLEHRAERTEGDFMDRADDGIVSGSVVGLILFTALFFPTSVRSQPIQIALEQPRAQLQVTGTLAKLDLTAGKGMLMTDLEKPIFFRLDRPELFERLSIGDRVTMELDEDGRVIKVIETLPAEIHEPPPPAK